MTLERLKTNAKAGQNLRRRLPNIQNRLSLLLEFVWSSLDKLEGDAHRDHRTPTMVAASDIEYIQHALTTSFENGGGGCNKPVTKGDSST